MTETFTHDDDRNINNNLSTFSKGTQTKDDALSLLEPYALLYLHSETPHSPLRRKLLATHSPFKRHSFASIEILSGMPAISTKDQPL